ncbi:MAG: phenol hydroxylase [Gammaproteobacteria bacterium]|nr:MAG: phenol hydroxylase [Gammaproteobacteria bacterium]
MTVKAIGPYPALHKDKVENFHGNQMVIIGWDRHLMIDAPMAFPLPPGMPFGAFQSEVMPAAFAAHPDWPQIDWSTVEWMLDGAPFTPDMEASLTDNGIGHKSVIRFVTPGLDGIGGSGS